MDASETQNNVTKRGAEDSGQYFRYMAEFTGFTEADVEIVKKTKPIIEKHLPDIVTKFYSHLLRYPPTRKFFLKKDGSIDHEYLELRMRHLANFWLRTADGVFDDDYARYVDYVGRAHTSRGADPKIYIAERYVIGQVGVVQHAISEALSRDLRGDDPEFEFQAVEAWDKLMMVILELLARAYGNEREAAVFDPLVPVDSEVMAEAVKDVFEHRERGPTKDVLVAEAAAIPDGERKIMQVDGLSIGVFHHKGGWYAYHNSCVHRGGPVATGNIDGDTLVCPWHGFEFNVTTGECLADPSARLDMYPVEVRDGQIYLEVPDRAATEGPQGPAAVPPTVGSPGLKPNEFCIGDISVGQIRLVHLGGDEVAVYNADGALYATQSACTHRGGPLSEGDLSGCVVTCPLHGSQFDVTTGQILQGPATEPLTRYQVIVDGETGRVEPAA
jgi:nitrite reductase (NADH) small subunit